MGGLRSKHPPFSDRKGYPVLQAVNPEQIYSGCRIIHHPKWTKPDSCIYGTKWRINRNAFRPSGRTRKGYGKQLIEFAIYHKHIFKVDVNEQNEKATSFYLNRGFDIVGRDETDPNGNPFPILHLSLNETIVQISDSSFEIRQILRHKKRFLDLLLLADEQESMIDLYLERGEMFALYDQNILKAICVVTDEGDKTVELKNIATDPQYQKQGYGKRLIRFISKHYAGKYDTLLVGTGESPLTIPFYEQNGFKYSHRIKNFFTDNYDHPIYEDGKQLVDMVYLRKELSKSK